MYLKENIGEAEAELETGTVNREHDTLRKFYDKLTRTLTDIDNLLATLVEKNVIGFVEEKDITNQNRSSVEKVKKLLSYIEGPLESGHPKGFYELLEIMKSKGVQTTKDLAHDIEKSLQN